MAQLGPAPLVQPSVSEQVESAAAPPCVSFAFSAFNAGDSAQQPTCLLKSERYADGKSTCNDDAVDCHRWATYDRGNYVVDEPAPAPTALPGYEGAPRLRPVVKVEGGLW